jgi:cytosine/adenosine deaminase-related metal-dependent hydrolase
MTTQRLYLKHADVLATVDRDGREIRDGALLTDGRRILRIGTSAELDAWLAAHPWHTPTRTIDMRGCVLTPGLVNCHHHMYQSLTRAIGTGRGLKLFDWLKMLYRVWAGITPDAVGVSTRVALAELLLSGATTVADHLYLFPNGCRLDDEIEAAQEMGVRFHPTRGSMSVGESAGGLPPDSLVEPEAAILRDSQRLVERWHDHAPLSMLRIGLAPCSPFSVSADLMRQSARLARSFERVGLHTHLAETLDEERYCRSLLGMDPLEYAESVEWLGPDVWFAHMVHPGAQGMARLAHTCSGVCHCPSSNMILASGIAPVREMIDAGIPVGLGVDGSASNDGNHMLGEARQAMLLQRVGWPGFESDASRFSAREALALATRGGARTLGREDEIGSLEEGKAADIVAFRVDGLAHAGAQGDPVAALLTCAPTGAWLSVINGQVVVEDGQLCGLDLGPLVEQHNRTSRALLAAAGLA